MPAFNELVENMNYVRQHRGGEFKVIVARKDTRTNSLKIKVCWPAPQLRMKIRTFDPTSG
jgi:hypothetical protein